MNLRHFFEKLRSALTMSLSSRRMGCEMNRKGTVFVTGGASGIGLAIARSLLDEGWRVVIADRAQGNLDKARGSFGEHDARLRFESLDVADENAVERAIDRCDTDFGPLVGLVNSAGIFGSETSALETDTGLFRQILEINLIGSFVASRTAARRMRARGKRLDRQHLFYIGSPRQFRTRRLWRLEGRGDPNDQGHGGRIGSRPGPGQRHRTGTG
jgi:NAD(P)-dependent dehydrogenase (short-subunit alcohol dehydrogenase family)